MVPRPLWISSGHGVPTGTTAFIGGRDGDRTPPQEACVTGGTPVSGALVTPDPAALEGGGEIRPHGVHRRAGAPTPALM